MRTLLMLALALGSFAHADTALVDPNLASKQELAAIGGLDDAVTQAIIDQRPYLTATDLDKALAELDDDRRVAIYAGLFRQINLNTASEAEIMLIPGMSKRMAHEFEEYRPYKDMDQFRREIGKYVDADEVARLESYVTLDQE